MSYKTLHIRLLSSWMFLLFLPLSVLGQFTGTNQVMNNGYLRFGNGTENSITNTGNLKQPWFYDDTTVPPVWKKLTFSSRDLEHRIAEGGDGTNEWNNRSYKLWSNQCCNQL